MCCSEREQERKNGIPVSHETVRPEMQSMMRPNPGSQKEAKNMRRSEKKEKKTRKE
jgi:hypothetical protein